DLIVLDVYMPGYGGLEVCQRLKESAETMKIPVLLTVGKMEPFKSDEAKRVHADAHIIKPFEASELLAALAKLEDRIVPQAGSSHGSKSGKEKRSRFWHGGDPVTNFADLPSDKVAYLAEVRKRQSESHGSEVPANNEESQPAVVVQTPAPAETAVLAEAALVSNAPDVSVQETNVAPQNAHDQSASTESQAAERVAEFAVTVEAVVEEAKVEHAIEEATGQESVPTAPAQETTVVTAEGEPCGSRWVAENVALTAEEASLALEQEMRQAQTVAPESPSTKPELPAEVESTNFEAPERTPSMSPP